MTSIKPGLENQLRRQSLWLRDSWFWLLETKVLNEYADRTQRLHALDVGCGPGLIMKLLESLFDIKGIDISPEMVNACKFKDLDVRLAAAEELPFENETFDIVYCSFLLLWVKDPVRVVSEMKRVSRRWILCLAEPDFGARLDYPDELSVLTELIRKGIREDGGDPAIGRKLRAVFSACDIDADIGVHSGIWTIDKLRAESTDEWRYIDMTAPAETKNGRLQKARRAWEEALENGSLFQFNPVFYAFGRKLPSAPHMDE